MHFMSSGNPLSCTVSCELSFTQPVSHDCVRSANLAWWSPGLEVSSALCQHNLARVIYGDNDAGKPGMEVLSVPDSAVSPVQLPSRL